MSSQKLLWPAVVGMGFITGIAWQVATAQFPNAKPVQRWEYKIGRGFSDDDLRRFGEDGWELVAVAGTGDSFTSHYFKRPK